MKAHQLVYVIAHLILAIVCLVVGIFTLLHWNVNLTQTAGAILCAAGAALIFHAAAALHGRRH